jgi:formyl-CoA transferase
MSITGLPGQGPVRVGIPIADLCAGILCSQAILVAVIERQTSGAGQWLHTSLLEAQIFMLDFQAARWLIKKEVPQQAGNNHPTGTPTGVFKTRDGFITIGAAGQKLWERMCVAIDAVSLIGDPDYATGGDRLRHRPALNKEIARRVESCATAEIIDRLNEAGVPCGPIYSIDETFADPQVRHLQLAQKADSAALGELDLVRQPVTLSRTPSAVKRASPERGEHSDEILQEFGFTSADIEGLRAAGAI